ncbi:response regulator transcription factor [Sediminicola sp. 1XM1-17]|uniref:response regulator transcription factor n=1 Tax=Sediminicola sp. 1XM1-17 TaxID=3127702 RepID=UPI00307752A9
MEKEYSLLLVEDDPSLGYLLTEYLKMKGFELTWAKSGKEGLMHAETNHFDLAILDVMMPEMDGFTLAEKIQLSVPDLPFLFLTARSLKIDVLKGFALGAVDYLKKPIDEEELVVRIHSLLSRLGKKPVVAVESKKYDIGKYQLNSINQELIYDKEVISLTGRENELLVYLVQNINQLCTHKDILIRLWGKNDYFNRKSLNVFVSHLRGYLSKDPNIKIDNVHGQGFILKVSVP